MNIPHYEHLGRPDQSIFVLEMDRSQGIEHLLQIVADDGNKGIKTDRYWMVSTDTFFMQDGTPAVEFYNTLMQNCKNRGYGYIQFTIKTTDNG